MMEDRMEQSTTAASRIPHIRAEWHTAFIQNFRDGIFTLDAEGRINFVNRVVLERSGRPLGWWIGRHPRDVVPPENAEMEEARVAAALRGEIPAPYEVAYETADGKVLWIELDYVAIAEETDIVGCIGISRNVTARKQAERALLQAKEDLETRVAQRTRSISEEIARRRRITEQLAASEEKYRALFEHALDGIAITKDGRIESANRALIDMLGFDNAKDVIGSHILDHAAPGSRALIEARMAARRRGEQPPVRFDLQVKHHSGSIRSFEASSTSLLIGEQKRMLVTFRDVTGRRRAESLLKRLLAGQRRAVDVVSHEARNPLTAIGGYVKLLQNGAYGALTQQQLEVLDKIQRNTDRLATLVTQFMEPGRIRARTLEERKTRVPLAPLLSLVMEESHALASEKDLDIVQETPADLYLHGDPDELREVFSILTFNAVKYSSRGRIILRALPSEGSVLIHVHDEGCGIPEEDLERVFEYAYRSAGSADNAPGGTGRGLSMAKEIIEDHGGEILVTSQVGVGSTFTVRLPAAPQPTAARSPTAAANA